jgi:hypothetical protein
MRRASALSTGLMIFGVLLGTLQSQSWAVTRCERAFSRAAASRYGLLAVGIGSLVPVIGTPLARKFLSSLTATAPQIDALERGDWEKVMHLFAVYQIAARRSGLPASLFYDRFYINGDLDFRRLLALIADVQKKDSPALVSKRLACLELFVEDHSDATSFGQMAREAFQQFTARRAELSRNPVSSPAPAVKKPEAVSLGEVPVPALRTTSLTAMTKRINELGALHSTAQNYKVSAELHKLETVLQERVAEIRTPLAGARIEVAVKANSSGKELIVRSTVLIGEQLQRGQTIDLGNYKEFFAELGFNSPESIEAVRSNLDYYVRQYAASEATALLSQGLQELLIHMKDPQP